MTADTTTLPYQLPDPADHPSALAARLLALESVGIRLYRHLEGLEKDGYHEAAHDLALWRELVPADRTRNLNLLALFPDHQLLALSHQLRTQDNLGTSHPIFMVQRRFTWLSEDPEANVGEEHPTREVWYDEDDNYVAREPELIARLEHLRLHTPICEDVVLVDEDYGGTYEQLYEHARWEHLTPFFTQEAADQFITRHAHNYPAGLRVYVDTGYHNLEWQFVRDLLLGLTGQPEVA